MRPQVTTSGLPAHPYRPATPDVLAQIGVGIEHHFGGGVYAKATTIPAGARLVQHRHRFDHLSILARGTVRLTVEGVSREVVGPVCLTIEAGKAHEVEALTDALWYCVHATDCTNHDIVDDALVMA